jgi:type VI secretion system protein ImpK
MGDMTNALAARLLGILEGSEKLNYLTGRLGGEVAQLRGKRASFAPHWAAPDRVAHALKRDVPLWVIRT